MNFKPVDPQRLEQIRSRLGRPGRPPQGGRVMGPPGAWREMRTPLEVRQARTILGALSGDVPATYAAAVANGDAPAALSVSYRYRQAINGRDHGTLRALKADGTPTRAGRPPGSYGPYDKTRLRQMAEQMAAQLLNNEDDSDAAG